MITVETARRALQHDHATIELNLARRGGLLAVSPALGGGALACLPGGLSAPWQVLAQHRKYRC